VTALASVRAVEPAMATLLDAERADIARGDVPGASLRIRGSAAGVATLLSGASTRPRVPSGVSVEGGTETLRAFLAAFDTRARARVTGAITTV
jgi:hypothetical protein